MAKLKVDLHGQLSEVRETIHLVCADKSPAQQLRYLSHRAAALAFGLDSWSEHHPDSEIRTGSVEHTAADLVQFLAPFAQRLLELATWVDAASELWDTAGPEVHDRVLSAADTPPALLMDGWCGFSGSPHLVAMHYAEWRVNQYMLLLGELDALSGERPRLSPDRLVPSLWRAAADNGQSSSIDPTGRRPASTHEAELLIDLLHRLRLRMRTATDDASPPCGSAPEGIPTDLRSVEDLRSLFEEPENGGASLKQVRYAIQTRNVRRFFQPSGQAWTSLPGSQKLPDGIGESWVSEREFFALVPTNKWKRRPAALANTRLSQSVAKPPSGQMATTTHPVPRLVRATLATPTTSRPGQARNLLASTHG